MPKGREHAKSKRATGLPQPAVWMMNRTGRKVHVAERDVDAKLRDGYTYPNAAELQSTTTTLAPPPPIAPPPPDIATRAAPATQDEARIAVVLPSRGLMFSEFVESVFSQPFTYGPFFAHNLPIPDCVEVPCGDALHTDCTHVLIIEDDVVLPVGATERLLAANVDVASGVYTVKREKEPGRPKPRIHGERNEWVPLGCLLVKRHVFEAMERPWFRTDVEWTRSGSGGPWTKQRRDPDPEKVYGGHDIYFSMTAIEMGFSVTTVEDVICGHCEEREKPSTLLKNDSCYQIIVHYPWGERLHGREENATHEEPTDESEPALRCLTRAPERSTDGGVRERGEREAEGCVPAREGPGRGSARSGEAGVQASPEGEPEDVHPGSLGEFPEMDLSNIPKAIPREALEEMYGELPGGLS